MIHICERPEILAPVGGNDQLIAAVRSGADAVYLGTKKLNARRNAQNFEDNTLRDVVSFCHTRGVKVHVVVNTLIKDSELGDAEEVIRTVAESGADAVIIQDLAVNRLFADMCPGIERHASTQMTIHNLDGALLAQDLGFKRAVLSRELSLKEIEYINAHSTIDTEVFVHGALCMSFSGSCYMSSIIGCRSGNRGLCAQPCRTDVLCGNRHYALSLKDMSHLDYLRDLRDVGVDSFKIEGRMKRPEYVAAAVQACNLALDGKEYDKKLLADVFSRDGFTDGYLTGKLGQSMFGRRNEADAEKTKTVLGQIASTYRNELQKIPVSLIFSAEAEKDIVLSVSDGVNVVKKTSSAAEKAVNRPTTEDDIKKHLSKTGGTPYTISSLKITVDSGLMIPASAVNAIRRDAFEELSQMRGTLHPHQLKERVTSRYDTAAKTPHRVYARFSVLDQIPDQIDSVDKIIVPADMAATCAKKFGREYIIAELPQISFDNHTVSNDICRQLVDIGIETVFADNIYALKAAMNAGLKVLGGPRLNVMNSVCLKELADLGVQEQTLSFELILNAAERMDAVIPTGIITYGRLPLMTVRNCPGVFAGTCKKCNGHTTITDRTGTLFPVMCSAKKYSTVYNSLPVYLLDKKHDRFSFEILYFTDESKSECIQIIDKLKGNAEPEKGTFTRGLYYRQVD